VFYFLVYIIFVQTFNLEQGILVGSMKILVILGFVFFFTACEYLAYL